MADKAEKQSSVVVEENKAKSMGTHSEAHYESPQSPPKEEHLHTSDEMPAQVGDGATESAKDPLNISSKKDNSELEKYWKAVRENAQDFTGWTYLLQYVEQENDLAAAREAFDAFFARYPYCYGYWKKYADLEKKNGNIDTCHEVFDRGVKAIPLSVDLWLHYLTFYKNQHKDEPGGEDKIRMVFECAVAAAGTEFKSDRLWDMYISWETDNKKLKNITTVYDRVLSTPTQMYSQHFDKFQEHVNSNLPKEILSTDEFLSLRQELVNSNAPDEEEAGGGDTPPPGVDDDAPPGEDPVPKVEKSPQADEETTALRRKIVELRRQFYKTNEDEVSKRWAFEEGIKRPYFHVKPLERAQLKNWRDYLDYEIANGSHERSVILFERCMIACALYEDLWTKYAKYLEPFSEEGARNVYSRACSIHLPRKPNIHLAWAAFEERLGNFSGAWAILDNLEKNLPGYLPVSFRRINLERRQGNVEQVEELYNNYIKEAKTTELASHYASKFARYYYKVLGNFDKATEILREAIKKDKDNSKLYLQLVDCCYQQHPVNEENILKAFEDALTSELPADQRLLFAQRKLEFYEDFGTDIKKLQDAYDDHARLMKVTQQDKKKRGLSDDMRGDDMKSKKAKIETNGVDATAMAATAEATAAMPATAAVVDQTAYSYPTSWTGWPTTNSQVTTDQAYNYHQTTWNPYGQHYYTGH